MAAARTRAPASTTQVQRQLVVLTEQVDRNVLRPGRLIPDHQVADGDDERRRPAEDSREELGNGNAGGACHGSGERGREIGGPGGGAPGGSRRSVERPGCHDAH